MEEERIYVKYGSNEIVFANDYGGYWMGSNDTEDSCVSELTPFDFSKLGIDIPYKTDINLSKRLTKEEFEESLIRDDVSDYYLSKSKKELMAELGGQVVDAIKGQRKYSYNNKCNIWEHTLKTIAQIKPDGLTPEQYKKTRVAAFFHEMDQRNDDGRVGKISAKYAEPILKKLGYKSDERSELSTIIGMQDEFDFLTKLYIRDSEPDEIASKIAEEMIKRRNRYIPQDSIPLETYKMALQLYKADISTLEGLLNKDKKLENLSKIEMCISEIHKLVEGGPEKDFASDIVNDAIQKVELREKEERAEQLLEQYSKQVAQDRNSVEENENDLSIDD